VREVERNVVPEHSSIIVRGLLLSGRHCDFQTRFWPLTTIHTDVLLASRGSAAGLRLPAAVGSVSRYLPPLREPYWS
jgi:hypothetical protein